MDYIVFDLETTMARNNGQTQIVLEIGAKRIKKLNGELCIVDSFNTYVRPTNIGLIDDRTLNMIGATMNDFVGASKISKSFQNFRKWISKSDDYYLCGWSTSDLWILASNRGKYKFDLSWVKNYIDIQPIVSQLLANKDKITLENAIVLSGIKYDKKMLHSASYDALNTAYLFIDKFNDIENTLKKDDNPFSVVSTPIIRQCPNCKEYKFYNKFRRTRTSKLKVCKACKSEAYIKRREERMIIEKLNGRMDFE